MGEKDQMSTPSENLIPLSLEATVAEIRRDMQTATVNLTSLTRIIRDGNGQQPLTVRVALLEKAQADVANVLREVRAALDQRAVEGDKGRWQLLTMVVTGLLALIASTISALILLRK